MRNLAYLLLIFSLSACGFHLRGSQPLAISGQNIYLASNNPYGDFEKLLRSGLSSADVTVTKSRTEADVTLQVINTRTNRRVVARDAGGRANEYEVTYFVVYNIIGKNQTTDSQPQTLYTTREYTFDNSQVLAKDEEERQLLEDMRRDLAGRVLRALAAFKPEETEKN